MPRTRTDVRLEAAGLLLASLADRYPEAIASLRRELDVVDGYSSATMQPRVAATAELTADGRLVEPAGPPGISRGRWAEAVDRARGWIPELSALDF